MDIGVIIALCVASFLTLISGVAAGLFGGMWWQARQTAQVWEKAYTHVREQLPAIRHDTYNTGRETPPSHAPDFTTGPSTRDPVREPRRDGPINSPAGDMPLKRVVVQAAVAPPVVPSKGAQSFGIELEDDPFKPQVRR